MGYSYGDFYGNYGDYDIATRTETGWALIAVAIMIFLFALAIELVFYLLKSFGLYKMAKTVGLSAPWLAFIPIANDYTLGKIAETPVNGKKTMRYGIILLFFNLAILVLGFAFMFYMTVMQLATGGEFGSIFFDAALSGTGYIGLLLCYIAIIALSIATGIFYYIAVYKLFKIFAPDNAVLYLVLTIVLGAGIVLPILIFMLRNKPVYGYGHGQIPPLGTPGYNPAYDQHNYNPYGYNQNNYTPNGAGGYQPPAANRNGETASAQHDNTHDETNTTD